MDRLEEQLRARFGLSSFRPWQREAIEALLDGPRRVLVIAPTGGGKSLCYQLPATLLEGTTVVVSPLIALMEDQVRALSERGIAATYLASNLGPDERRERERRLADGGYDLVYVAPERLANPRLVDQLAALEPPLLAIDEAHCISQWGHDFRPDYLRLGPVLKRLRPRHVLACTATATPLVRREIVTQLGLPEDDTRVVLRGFARPNLHLAAQELDRPKDIRDATRVLLADALGPASSPRGGALVYAATRRNTETTATELASLGYRTLAYHAGMTPERRTEVSERFAAREVDVVVATNAFGMGIDRPDVRAVVHTQAPGSIEAYYQEVGRAGRDGEPAHGLLLTSSADIHLRRRLIEGFDPMAVRSAERVEQQWSLFRDLLRYVEAGSCRHDFILRYFGDEQETLGGCGHCDVCSRLEELGGERERAVTPEDALLVRKALAGVARAHGRVGMRAVAEMLHGKDTEKLRRMGLDRLSTFGLLSEHHPTFLLTLLRRLVSAGLVSVTADEYPCVLLTPAGVPAMKGEAAVRVLLPDPDVGRSPRRGRAARKRAAAAEAPALPAADAGLFEALREARLEQAKDAGVPAYVVCHDRTLAEIAQRRPTSAEELALVHGMGPHRVATWGAAFLDVVARHG